MKLVLFTTASRGPAGSQLRLSELNPVAYCVEMCVLKNWPGEPESQNLRIGRCPAWTWSCGWLQKALERKVCCGFYLSIILLNSFENQTQSREEELAQNGVGAQPGASACELPGGPKHSALHCRTNLFFFFNWDFYKDESFVKTVQVRKEWALWCPWVSVWVVLLIHSENRVILCTSVSPTHVNRMQLVSCRSQGCGKLN